MIFLLNGASSSGKTSLARAIQEQDERPWLLLGIDTMIDMMPRKYFCGGSHSADGFDFVQTSDDTGPLLRCVSGAFGQRVNVAMIDIAGLLSTMGFNIIIDEVLLSETVMQLFLEKLIHETVYFIGVHCELTVLLNREKARDDRLPGSARDQMMHCHQQKIYDLQIDTTDTSVEENTGKILQLINDQPNPQSFIQMAKLFTPRV